MQKQCVSAPNAAPAVGPYSHAVRVGNLLFTSGQCPFAKDGSGAVLGTVTDESRRALDNLQAVLEAGGSGLAHVIKVTAYLTDMDNFSAFNDVYKEYFREECPARTCIQAAALPLGVQVEVEAIALIPE